MEETEDRYASGLKKVPDGLNRRQFHLGDEPLGPSSRGAPATEEEPTDDDMERYAYLEKRANEEAQQAHEYRKLQAKQGGKKPTRIPAPSKPPPPPPSTSERLLKASKTLGRFAKMAGGDKRYGRR